VAFEAALQVEDNGSPSLTSYRRVIVYAKRGWAKRGSNTSTEDVRRS